MWSRARSRTCNEKKKHHENIELRHTPNWKWTSIMSKRCRRVKHVVDGIALMACHHFQNHTHTPHSRPPYQMHTQLPLDLLGNLKSTISMPINYFANWHGEWLNLRYVMAFNNSFYQRDEICKKNSRLEAKIMGDQPHPRDLAECGNLSVWKCPSIWRS